MLSPLELDVDQWPFFPRLPHRNTLLFFFLCYLFCSLVTFPPSHLASLPFPFPGIFGASLLFLFPLHSASPWRYHLMSPFPRVTFVSWGVIVCPFRPLFILPLPSSYALFSIAHPLASNVFFESSFFSFSMERLIADDVSPPPHVFSPPSRCSPTCRFLFFYFFPSLFHGCPFACSAPTLPISPGFT